MPLKQAVILCGGKGTRLGDVAKSLPKPLVVVGGRAILDYLIEGLVDSGIEKILLAAGHLGHVIQDAYRVHSHRCDIRVTVESKPMGTAGALRIVEEELDESFVVAYGDIFTDFDMKPLLYEHARNNAMATLLVRASDHPWDSHLVVHDEDLRIREFVAKREVGRRYQNVANAAFYALSKRILNWIPKDTPCDFGADVFPMALASGARLQAHYLRENGFVKDMGTPDRLRQVEEYLEECAAARLARARRRSLKVVLLDRDGTLNADFGLVRTPDELQLLPGVAQAISRLKGAGMKLVVITNQPVIARGDCSLETLDAIHDRLREEIVAAGGTLEAIHYCPHHPETHHGEGVPELRRACHCRKPAPGLIFRAMREQQIDLAESVMVGDRATDVQAGRAAGVRTVLVGPAANRAREAAKCRPDAEFDSLADFATALLGERVFHDDSK